MFRRLLLAAAAALPLASPTLARDRAVAWAFQLQHPCPSTGSPHGACPGWTRDHWVPLCAGGADDPSNMWWEDTRRSLDKDQAEFALCRALDRAQSAADPASSAAIRAAAWTQYWSALQAMGGEEAAAAGRWEQR